MILICGIPSEPSIAMVIEQIMNLGQPCIVFNQRHFIGTEFEFEINNGKITGWMQLEGRNYRLEHIRSVYTRLMDYRFLPEIENDPPNTLKRQYCRSLHDTITRWCEITPARVLNRMAEVASNFSKPYQAQFILKHGFAIPETLITNDPNLVLEFRKKHKQVIYKSISCIRSIVQILEDKHLGRLNYIRWCPTQFQEFIEGSNIRVHIIGNEVFATAVSSGTVDYRYAYMQGKQEELKIEELPHELAERCIKLSQALGLEFAGIDLKITPDNHVYCLEVNPSPAFSYYEHYTGQPIARAIAKYLAHIS